MQLAFHAAAGLLVLLVPTVLSIYKPRGVTEHGRRTQGRAAGDPGHPVDSASTTASAHGAITITLRRSQVISILCAIFVLHLVVLHMLGIGHLGH